MTWSCVRTCLLGHHVTLFTCYSFPRGIGQDQMPRSTSHVHDMVLCVYMLTGSSCDIVYVLLVPQGDRTRSNATLNLSRPFFLPNLQLQHLFIQTAHSHHSTLSFLHRSLPFDMFQSPSGIPGPFFSLTSCPISSGVLQKTIDISYWYALKMCSLQSSQGRPRSLAVYPQANSILNSGLEGREMHGSVD